MKLLSQTSTIVLIGSFNPPIFQPLWLKEKELISPTDYENAALKIASIEISDFSLDWAHAQVTADRFFIQCTDMRRSEAMRDLAVGIFEILAETPLLKLGINLESKYQAQSEEQWNALGYKIVPPNFWNNHMNEPGMIKAEVREKKRQDEYLGFFGVTVRPAPNSNEKENFGVIISTNDHYAIEDKEGIVNSEPILNILKHQWEPSMRRSEKISAEVVGLV